MTVQRSKALRRGLTVVVGATALLSTGLAARAGTLYLGSESEQTALGIFTTSGPSVTVQSAVATSGYAFNGVGEGSALKGIVTGALDSGNFNTRDLAGGVTGSFANATPGYLNEDFAGNGTQLWRANSGGNGTTIYRLDPTNGATLEVHSLTGASQLVGLTFVGSQLWAGDFGAGTVGKVDTTLNTYTPVFSAFGAGALGGLAYDAKSGVLWVGSFSVLRPYDVSGAILGPDVSTLATYGGFIDGLAYIPSAVPEPASWTMMLLGLGALGAVLRGSRRRPARIAA